MIQLLSFCFPLFSLIFSLLSPSNGDSNIYIQCSQLYFNPMTPYELNVNSLFTSLVDSATISNFNKFEISRRNVVYGLFQCQGDLSTPSCKDCVANAVSQLRTTCRVSTSATIQLESCFVKYDNKSFFGIKDKMEVYKRCGPSIGYNSDVLNHIDEAMAYLVAGNGQYFHEGDFGSIQGVSQCLQDLSLSDCQDCLLEASGRLKSECDASTWGAIYLGKCYLRYVNQGDDGHSNVGNNKSDTHHGDGETIKIILKVAAYLAAAAAGGGLTIALTVSIKNYNKKGSSGDIEETPRKQRIQTVDVIHEFKRPVELTFSNRNSMQPTRTQKGTLPPMTTYTDNNG